MYDIAEHKHRFATWAASRAASVKGCRFKVENGKSILDNSGLRKISNVSLLPIPEDFDKKHKEWRTEIVKLASSQKLNFTHGIAAKMINIYLKIIFVNGGFHQEPKVKAIHPPIDELLLFFLHNKYVTNKLSGLSDIKHDSAFSGNEYFILKSDLLKKYEKGDIENIERR